MGDTPLIKYDHAPACTCSECHPAEVVVRPANPEITAEPEFDIKSPQKIKPVDALKARTDDLERRVRDLEYQAGTYAKKPTKSGIKSINNWILFIFVIGIVGYLVFLVYMEAHGHHIKMPF